MIHSMTTAAYTGLCGKAVVVFIGAFIGEICKQVELLAIAFLDYNIIGIFVENSGYFLQRSVTADFFYKFSNKIFVLFRYISINL